MRNKPERKAFLRVCLPVFVWSVERAEACVKYEHRFWGLRHFVRNKWTVTTNYSNFFFQNVYFACTAIYLRKRPDRWSFISVVFIVGDMMRGRERNVDECVRIWCSTWVS